MSLHISINTPSKELDRSPIDEAITFLAAHVAIERHSGGLPAGPSLDVTFMLPGKHEVPPFRGMRMGGYSDDGRTLFFETAVPEQVLHSDFAPRYVALVMEDVIDHASEFFKANDVPFDEELWRSALGKLTGDGQGDIH